MWTAGFLCVGLVAAVVGVYAAGFAWAFWVRRHVTRYAEERGDPTIGWIIQANPNLYKYDTADYPAFVLVSPDPDTADDSAFMADLADRLGALRGKRRLTDRDEQFVVDVLEDEEYTAGRRDRVPKSLTGGRRVTIAHIWVFYRHLPDKQLTLPYVMCYVVWDDPAAWIISRPYPTQRAARRAAPADR